MTDELAFAFINLGLLTANFVIFGMTRKLWMGYFKDRKMNKSINGRTAITDGPIVEKRMLVHGWKIQDGKQREFVSNHHFSNPGLKFEEGRIGADLPLWQPHITSVVVEERTVTPWRETYRTSMEADTDAG